nr:immunoglobulin light chain junction region [Macaca mulatta]
DYYCQSADRSANYIF